MDDTPLISVIVPVYNVSTYLDKCVESLVEQTYTNLEIIFVNDGSTDSSGEICDLWAQKDSRIKVIHQQNAGLSGARNAALPVATGEYIMFVDSDDFLHPELCQTLYDSLDGAADISICDAAHAFPNDAPAFSISTDSEIMTPAEAIIRMWYQKDFLPSAWGKLYRRQLFECKRFTVGRLFEDIDIMHEIFYEANSIIYNHSRLYGYVHREGSITTKRFSVRDLDILLIADKLLTFAQDKPELEKAAQAYAITAALRVYLNAPKDDTLSDGIAQAKALLSQYGKSVLRDPNIRKKNRYALQLYFFCRLLMHPIYQLIDRWK